MVHKTLTYLLRKLFYIFVETLVAVYYLGLSQMPISK